MKCPSAAHLAHTKRAAWLQRCKQDRRWLHHQVQQPDRNGITRQAEIDLSRLFGKPSDFEQNTPKMSEGNRMCEAAAEGWRRLKAERAGQEEKQGTSDVVDWWVGKSGGKSGDGEEGMGEPKVSNRKAKALRFKENREAMKRLKKAVREQKQAGAATKDEGTGNEQGE